MYLFLCDIILFKKNIYLYDQVRKLTSLKLTCRNQNFGAGVNTCREKQEHFLAFVYASPLSTVGLSPVGGSLSIASCATLSNK